jgi:hypothetical protein
MVNFFPLQRVNKLFTAHELNRMKHYRKQRKAIKMSSERARGWVLFWGVE